MSLEVVIATLSARMPAAASSGRSKTFIGQGLQLYEVFPSYSERLPGCRQGPDDDEGRAVRTGCPVLIDLCPYISTYLIDLWLYVPTLLVTRHIHLSIESGIADGNHRISCQNPSDQLRFPGSNSSTRSSSHLTQSAPSTGQKLTQFFPELGVLLGLLYHIFIP